ncbi:MAG: HAMP domain-containing protein [Planctomycetes bacterium]|nr:HAMP domain-containing protein [Planctomycetota bacterium]
MSYRALKHLIGETGLERKCRLMFSVIILVLITASFYWYGRKSEGMVHEQNLNTCRMLVNPILFRRHWTALETQRDFVPVIDALFGELLPPEVRGYKSKVIKPDDPSHLPENDFEYAAMTAFQKGDLAEQYRAVPGEASYQYLAAVRLKSDCIVCHPTLPNSKPSDENDFFAAVSIKLPLDRTNQAIQDNRWILISTAVITAGLAMIISYVIVRYVIVKPVKHLRDVSDAVAAGNTNIRADIQTRDEFEELCHAFNRMLRNLIAMQEELRGVNRELDRKVDELAQANMALHDMNKLKSEFMATMSHELRTPLNSVIGFSEVLSTSDRLSEKECRYAANIHRSGKMLLGLINDILDLAKIESGKMEVRTEEFSIRDVIEGLLTMIRPIAEEKSIQIETNVDPEIPVLYQDSGKLQQILYNLLSNAVKFTPEGGRVSVSVNVAATDLVLAVADTGVGIPPEDRDRIFEKFRQGSVVSQGTDPVHTRQYSGTGLGLSIVRELCHMLGGEVTLESELGRGSTFKVRLPLRLEKAPRVPLADERLDLSKARRLDPQLLASAQVDG